MSKCNTTVESKSMPQYQQLNIEERESPRGEASNHAGRCFFHPGWLGRGVKG